ncbi:Retrovirus zinc finger-like protein [Glarea lozoyensis ATCC 20868]|uniref:Retrovirus zinc finger-like protein n=1 Tax=Glarea lozoyensis (strain ATCC 20868 / MF5171) TaxID=1116229 RepID=S3CZW0_GLAL2|nr:Retrovirus zinc finger-like protein [Glarea lozoyensis ATCC 20868]EPE30439.1 Retrovirus zinc finger-like protein [Glarea lozoyensis ATCC 20868]
MEDDLSDSDSRTVVVGRKRDLQDMHYPDVSAGAVSSDDESRPAHLKRQKQNHDTSSHDREALVVGADGTPAKPAERQLTASEFEVLEMEHENPQKASSHSSSAVLEDQISQSDERARQSIGDANVAIPPDKIPANSAVGWNRGVQSGLRTSFGNKKQIKTSDQSQPSKSRNDSRSSNALELDTSKVEPVLLREKTWPLPSRYRDLMDLVNEGKTLYPSHKINKKQQPFRINGEEFHLRQVWDEEALPYKVTDLSFNIWIVQFLRMNATELDNLRARKIWFFREAFNRYIETWYWHVPQYRQRLVDTSTGSDVLTPETAVDIAIKFAPLPVKDMKRGPEKLHDTPAKPPVTQPGQKRTRLTDSAEHVTRVSSSVADNLSCSKADVRDITSSTLSEMPQSKPPQPADVTKVVTIPSSDDADGSSSSESSDHDVEMGNASPESRASTGAYGIDVDAVVEMALQRKYFSGDSPSSSIHRCLACGDDGHWRNECAVLDCGICGEQGKHSNFTCPKNQRCSKCSQRGHSFSSCPEKLQATKAEAGACGICQDKDHWDSNCHFVWRSFAPKPEEIRTVSRIPIHCYTCGATGHYGPECGLHSGPLLSGGYTWSQRNVRKYLDNASNDRAVSAGIDYTLPKFKAVNDFIPPPKDFSIKGKGKANDPFTVEDSEDDVDFLRPRVNPSTQRGHINFGKASQNQPRPQDSGFNRSQHMQNYPEDNMQYNVSGRGNYGMDYNRRQQYYPSTEYPAFAQSENLAPTEALRQNSDKPGRKRKSRTGGHESAAPKPKKQKPVVLGVPSKKPKKPKKTKRAKRREAEARLAQGVH